METITKDRGVCLWQPTENEFSPAAILISPEPGEIILEQEGNTIIISCLHLNDFIKQLKATKEYAK